MSPIRLVKIDDPTAVKQDAAQSLETDLCVLQHRRTRPWQKLALVLVTIAAIGMVVWFHLATVMLESAFKLMDQPDSRQIQPAEHQSAMTLVKLDDNVTIEAEDAIEPVFPHTTTMLFDDTAKLAIDAQLRRDKEARDEKVQARGKGVNLEWQRHHHLDGSVYQPCKYDR